MSRRYDPTVPLNVWRRQEEERKKRLEAYDPSMPLNEYRKQLEAQAPEPEGPPVPVSRMPGVVHQDDMVDDFEEATFLDVAGAAFKKNMQGWISGMGMGEEMGSPTSRYGVLMGDEAIEDHEAYLEHARVEDEKFAELERKFGEVSVDWQAQNPGMFRAVAATGADLFADPLEVGMLAAGVGVKSARLAARKKALESAKLADRGAATTSRATDETAKAGSTSAQGGSSLSVDGISATKTPAAPLTPDEAEIALGVAQERIARTGSPVNRKVGEFARKLDERFKLRQRWTDETAPLQDAFERTGTRNRELLDQSTNRILGVEGTIDAQLTQGTRIWNRRTQSYEVTGESLQDIVGDFNAQGMKEFDEFVLARSQRELVDRPGGRFEVNAAAEKHLNDLEKLEPEKYAYFDELHARFTEFNNRAIVDPLVAVGRISKETGEKIKRVRQRYSPIQSKADEVLDDIQASGELDDFTLHQIRQGLPEDLPVSEWLNVMNSPTEATVSRVVALQRYVVRQEQRNMLGDIAYRYGDELQDLMGFKPFKGSQEVPVYRDGQRFKLHVDADIAKALDSFDPKVRGTAAKLYLGLMRVMRNTRVLNPAFIGRMLARDLPQKLIYNESGDGLMRQMGDVGAAITEVIGKGDLYRTLKAEGMQGQNLLDPGYTVSQSLMRRMSRGKVSENAQAIMEQLSIEPATARRIADYAGDLWDGAVPGFNPNESLGTQALAYVPRTALNVMERLAGVMEDIPRVAEARGILRSGGTMQEAVHGGRDIVIDFGRSGEWGGFINTWGKIFFNAEMRDFEQFVRKMKKRPGRTAASAVSLLGTMELMNYSMNHDREAWRDAPPWMRSMFYFGPSTSVRGKEIPFLFPKPVGMLQVMFGDPVSIALDTLFQARPEETAMAVHRATQGEGVETEKGDLVRSKEEADIANWLYRNGIEYEYERSYPGEENYHPDFYFPQHDTYLEHFGQDQFLQTAPGIDPVAYQEQREWKQATHAKNGTRMLETSSGMSQEGQLLEQLQARLAEAGITPNEGLAPKLSRVANGIRQAVPEMPGRVAGLGRDTLQGKGLLNESIERTPLGNLNGLLPGGESPLSDISMFLGPFRPGFEAAMNEDYFRGRPIETDTDQKLAPQDRVGPTTTDTARFLSDTTNGWLSPKKIDHIGKSFLGGWYDEAMALPDAAARQVTDSERPRYPDRPYREPLADALSVAGAAYPHASADGFGSESVRQLYDLHERVSALDARMKEIEDPKERRAFERENPLVVLDDQLSRARGRLSQLAKKRTEILRAEGEMDEAERYKRLQEIEARIGSIAENALGRFRKKNRKLQAEARRRRANRYDQHRVLLRDHYEPP